jgi:hypothetical protein
MVVEGYHVLCSSCFVAIWVENLMCPSHIYIKSGKSTREETRVGINIVLCSSCDDVLPCCKIHDDVEKEDAFWGLCAMMNSSFPLSIVAHLISLAVVSLSTIHLLINELHVLNIILFLSRDICFNDCFSYWGSIG